MHSKLLVFLFFSGVLLSSTSCVNSRKALYFNNIQDTTLDNALVSVEPVIQVNDLLNITVTSLNPEASMVFNTPNITMPVTATSTGTTPAAGYGAPQLMGYLVNADGTIKFPVLGPVKAAGLTKRQLEVVLTDSLTNRKLLVDPIVTARFLNFRVTVLGEVAKPTTLNVANERISIFEALGLAGDVTIYAKRNNVLLIRESGDKKIVKRLDLSANNILTSPYYYLKTNDIVYVEPRKEKIAATSRTQQLLPIILSAASLVAVVVLHYVD
ncbi:MAG TPA: polysaccharide biosynthesis/export family protein [Puia sp.]|nr:polysaccharide biosynthesis/export family protein [Puia sp.]